MSEKISYEYFAFAPISEFFPATIVVMTLLSVRGKGFDFRISQIIRRRRFIVSSKFTVALPKR